MPKKFAWIAMLCSLLFVAEAGAAAQAVGKAAAVAGTVTLQRGGKNYRLVQGTTLYNGDSVVTPRDGHAKLLMVDESLITVGSRSNFRIDNFSANRSNRAGSFRLFFGKMRAIVSKYAAGRSDIRFSTPTAVAGVRGTHLVVEYDYQAKKTTVSVLEGSVAFRSLQQQAGSEVVLGARQQAVQIGNRQASAPAAMSAQQIEQLAAEIQEQTPSPSEGERKRPNGPGGNDSQRQPAGTPAPEPEDTGAQGGSEAAEKAEQNLNRIDPAIPTEQSSSSEHNPASHPAADSGIRVRW